MRTRFTVQKPKKYLATLIISVLLWLGVGTTILLTNPQTLGIVPLLLFLLFSALLFSISLIAKNSVQGLIFSLAIIFFLVLRILGIGNILNLILIVGIVVAVEIFLRKK